MNNEHQILIPGELYEFIFCGEKNLFPINGMEPEATIRPIGTAPYKDSIIVFLKYIKLDNPYHARAHVLFKNKIYMIIFHDVASLYFRKVDIK